MVVVTIYVPLLVTVVVHALAVVHGWIDRWMAKWLLVLPAERGDT